MLGDIRARISFCSSLAGVKRSISRAVRRRSSQNTNEPKTKAQDKGYLPMAQARDPRQPDDVDVEVGRRVRVERIARGLTQTELANRIGVTFQQVQKYEIGA